MNKLINMKYFKMLLVFASLFAVIACGGTDEIAEKMEVIQEKVEEKVEQKTGKSDDSDSEAEMPNLSGELSVEVTVEMAPLTLSILEGKAQFNMKDGQGWIDAVDAQPIEQVWGVKTLPYLLPF